MIPTPVSSTVSSAYAETNSSREEQGDWASPRLNRLTEQSRMNNTPSTFQVLQPPQQTIENLAAAAPERRRTLPPIPEDSAFDPNEITNTKTADVRTALPQPPEGTAYDTDGPIDGLWPIIDLSVAAAAQDTSTLPSLPQGTRYDTDGHIDGLFPIINLSVAAAAQIYPVQETDSLLGFNNAPFPSSELSALAPPDMRDRQGTSKSPGL